MTTPIPVDSSAFTATVNEAKELDRQARFGRNVIVVLSIVLTLLILFVLFMIKPEMNLLQQISMVAMTILFWYLSVAMTRDLKTGKEENWTLATRLDIEIEKIGNQLSSYKSLPMRFLLPMFAVVVMGSYGGYYQRTGTLIPDANLAFYYAGAIVIFCGTAWGYLNSAKKKLSPLLDKLLDLRRQLAV